MHIFHYDRKALAVLFLQVRWAKRPHFS